MDENILNTLKHMTYGIYVLTTRDQSLINGMVASWVSQVSYSPLLIMAAIHPNRFSHKLVEQSGFFALHILSQSQGGFLPRFKGPDPAAKFDGLEWQNGKTGCPVLKDCIGVFECRVTHTYSPGNHTLFVGEVLECNFRSDLKPLTTCDYAGCYLGKD